PLMQNNETSAAWMRHFVPLLRPFRWKLVVAVTAMVLDASINVFRPWPLKVVIDRVLSHRPSRVPFLRAWLDTAPFDRLEVLYGACAAMLLIAVTTGLLTYYITRSMGDLAHDFVFAIRRDLFAHLQRLSLRFHDKQRTGDLIARLTSDIEAIQEMVANGIIVFGSNAFLRTGMLVLMFWLNWRFALASLAAAPLLFWTVFRYKRRIKIAARKVRASASLLTSLAQETFASVRIVQGLAQEEQQDERFQAHSESNLQAYLESVRYQARVTPVVDILAAVGITIVMWY